MTTENLTSCLRALGSLPQTFHTLDYVAYLWITPIQAIFGLVGNLASIMVASYLPDRISSLSLRYLAGLNAIVSLLYTFYPFGEKLAALHGSQLVFTCAWMIFVRKFVIVLLETLQLGSVLVMTFFFLDRYIIISHPHLTQRWRNSTRVHNLVPLLSVLLALVWCLPILKWYEVRGCDYSHIFTPHPGIRGSYNFTLEYGRGIGQLLNRSLGSNSTTIQGSWWPTHLCSRRVEPKNITYQVYEIIRELLFVVVPILAMIYFVTQIAISINRFHKSHRSSHLVSRVSQMSTRASSQFYEVHQLNYRKASNISYLRTSQISLTSVGGKIAPLSRYSPRKSKPYEKSRIRHSSVRSRVDTMERKAQESTDEGWIGVGGAGAEQLVNPTKESSSLFKIFCCKSLCPGALSDVPKSSHANPHSHQPQGRGAEAGRENVTIIMYGFIALYCLSIIPAMVLTILYTRNFKGGDANKRNAGYRASLIAIASVLEQANYTWCFYLYAVLDTVFMNKCKYLLGLLRRR